MGERLVVANWKSYKNSSEAASWLEKLGSSLGVDQQRHEEVSGKKIIVCPPFTLLSVMAGIIKEKQLPIMLGVQDISPFDEGAYTGSVNAGQASEFAQYVIIGHSERRTLFNEDDTVLTQKVAMAKKHGLTPIFCVQDKNTPIPLGITIVAYEPPSAIGTGVPDTPENADAIAKIIKEKNGIRYVLYGGSVKSGNVKSFTKRQNIDGVLVGGASLDPLEFSKIIEFS